MSVSQTQTAASRQLVKFAIVGCLNVAVSFVTFLVCYRYVPLASFVLDAMGAAGANVIAAMNRVGVPTVDAGFANVVGYAVGMLNSFLLNKTWTFEAKGRTAVQARRFVALNVVGLAFSTLAVLVMVDVLGFAYLPVWIATTAFVMLLNFLGNKYWTFVADPSSDGHAVSADVRV
jgi:putative flippase GtrA